MLTITQISSILLLLQAFGVGQATIDEVRAELMPPVVVVQPAPQVPLPVFGGITPPQTPNIPSCDITPVITITTDKSSLDITHNPNGYVTATTDVKDGCGKEYPYNITLGAMPFRTNLSAKGVLQPAFTGSNVWQWEVGHPDVAAGTHPATYPFPVIVSTDTDSSTVLIDVE